MAVAAYLRTGQNIAHAHKNVDIADHKAREAEAITQAKRQDVLKKKNDERKLDVLIKRLERDAQRHKG